MSNDKAAPAALIPYEEWMFDGCVALEARTYGLDARAAAAAMHWRLRHPYASREGVAVVALADKKVVGLQTWMPWPYRRKGKSFRSMQSGGSLVDESCRGQGLFSRLLKAGTKVAVDRGTDFFTGFPVKMSYGAFLKDSWAKVAAPRWWTAFGRLDTVVWAEGDSLLESGRFTALAPGGPDSGEDRSNAFLLSEDPEFLAWRYGGGRLDSYYCYRHEGSAGPTVFVLRLGRRRGIEEVMVVDWRSTPKTPWPAARALWSLRFALLREGRGALVTVLLHEGPDSWRPKALLAAGFVPTWKTARYIVKDLRGTPNAYDPDAWVILARDMDTG
jgi:GNAT superfamily N-acetyltransferase